jgi:hypothetical protein
VVSTLKLPDQAISVPVPGSNISQDRSADLAKPWRNRPFDPSHSVFDVSSPLVPHLIPTRRLVLVILVRSSVQRNGVAPVFDLAHSLEDVHDRVTELTTSKFGVDEECGWNRGTSPKSTREHGL